MQIYILLLKTIKTKLIHDEKMQCICFVVDFVSSKKERPNQRGIYFLNVIYKLSYSLQDRCENENWLKSKTYIVQNQ
jgi:hypothetical protein